MNSVDQLFRQLVEVLAADDPDRLTGPIQISELYQTILPYRAYKKALQFDTNQDYEMAMLQLLAGDGGYASVEPVEVRDALIKEATAINPNPATFRDYAAARVLLDPEAVHSAMAAGQSYAPPAESAPSTTRDPYAPPLVQSAADAAARYEPRPADSDSAEGETPVSDIEPSSPPQPQAPMFVAVDSPSPAAPATWPQEDAGVCPFCDQTLPTGRTVIFCPFCGGRVVPLKCERCGDELEPAWRYCPACGTAAPDG